MIQGDVCRFLDALGAREGDPLLDQALSFVGGEYGTSTYVDGGVESKYLLMSERGVDVLLEDGVLDTVFVYATESDEHGVYGAAEALVEGVDFGASPADLVRVLGEPKRSTRGYVLYAVDPGFVQFDFDGDTLMMVVVMRRDIGG